MTTTETEPTAPAPERRSGELTLRELLRWAWRQLTSMRIALILLLMLALAAVPGSLDPAGAGRRAQGLAVEGRARDADAGLREARPLQRLRVAVVRRDLPPAGRLAGRLHRAAHLRLRARACGPSRPPAPRNLTRLPATRRTARPSRPTVVLERARALLKPQALPAARASRRRRDRSAPSAATCARSATCSSTSPCWWCWSASRIGTLFGYKGGVILVQGTRSATTSRSTTTSCPAPCSTPTAWTRSPSPSTTSTSSGSPSGHGARASTPRCSYTEAPGDAGEALRPQGQPPAEDRRDRAVPHRPRLRAGRHGPRRRRQHRGVRAGAVPADGAGPVLLRRGQGARRASRARSGWRASSTRPSPTSTARRSTSAARTSTRCSR